jgi:hypothetical protein
MFRKLEASCGSYAHVLFNINFLIRRVKASPSQSHFLEYDRWDSASRLAGMDGEEESPRRGRYVLPLLAVAKELNESQQC